MLFIGVVAIFHWHHFKDSNSIYMSEILSMLQEKYSFITKIEVYQIKIKYLCYCLIQQIMYHLDFETDLHIEIKKV